MGEDGSYSLSAHGSGDEGVIHDHGFSATVIGEYGGLAWAVFEFETLLAWVVDDFVGHGSGFVEKRGERAGCVRGLRG